MKKLFVPVCGIALPPTSLKGGYGIVIVVVSPKVGPGD